MIAPSTLLVAVLVLASAGRLTADPADQPERDPRPPAEFVEGGSPVPAGAVSLFHFNTPGSRQRIEGRRAFFPVFTGISERDGHPREVLALRILLGDPGVCLAAPRLLRALAASTRPEPSRLPVEIAALRSWIEQQAAAADFSSRHLSYAGEGGKLDPDFLLYTSPHRYVAQLYGEVVFEIRERVPRGVDLNALNREVYDYYRQLPLAAKLNPRGLIIRALLDRDEYVIPSHVPGPDVVAADIHARVPFKIGAGMVRLSGRLQRRYQRGTDGRRAWVDALDRSGRPIVRFSCDPETPPPAAPRSSAMLPPEVSTSASKLVIGGRPVLMQ